jgi:hypothetical protein
MTAPVVVTSQTVGLDDAETVIIADTYNLVMAGHCYLDSAQVHAGGTHILMIKGATGTAEHVTQQDTRELDRLRRIERAARELMHALDRGEAGRFEPGRNPLAAALRQALEVGARPISPEGGS